MTTSLLMKNRDLCQQNPVKQVSPKTIKEKERERNKADYIKPTTETTNIPNKDIFRILLEASMELELSESEQLELLSCLNAFNEKL